MIKTTLLVGLLGFAGLSFGTGALPQSLFGNTMYAVNMTQMFMETRLGKPATPRLLGYAEGHRVAAAFPQEWAHHGRWGRLRREITLETPFPASYTLPQRIAYVRGFLRAVEDTTGGVTAPTGDSTCAQTTACRIGLTM